MFQEGGLAWAWGGGETCWSPPGSEPGRKLQWGLNCATGQTGLCERGRFWEMQRPELENGWEIPVHSCSDSKGVLRHDRGTGTPIPSLPGG